MSFTAGRVQKRDVGIGTMDGLMLGRHGTLGSSAGQSVTKATVATLPAVHRAWSFAANSVAVLKMAVWRDDGPSTSRVTNLWQSRLMRGTPNERQDWMRFWYTVQKSLESRNNAYVWKTKNEAGQVTALTALHPDQVFPYLYQVRQSELQYPVMFTAYYPMPPECDGFGIKTVDRSTIWHIPGDGGCGEVVPPTPIQTFATSFGIALAKQDYEANLYQNGVMGGLAVTFPAGMTPEQARKWKALFDSDNAGTGNTGATKVIGGGATMSQIGMTQKDAQFIESGYMSLLDIANMTGVPAWILNANEKAEKAQLPEHEEARWVHHGLVPRLRRIESSLYAESDIFGAGSAAYPAFDTGELIHPDAATADTIAHQRVQDGRMLVDEWRVPNGYAPLPNGLGEIPQIIPVGGSPAGVPTAAPDPTASE